MGIKKYAKKKLLEAAAQELQTTDAPAKVIAIDGGIVMSAISPGAFRSSFI